jgi:hypothetical protein
VSGAKGTGADPKHPKPPLRIGLSDREVPKNADKVFSKASFATRFSLLVISRVLVGRGVIL